MVDLDFRLEAHFHLFLPESVGQNACRLMEISQVVLFRLLRYPQVLEKKGGAFQNAMNADCENCKLKWKNAALFKPEKHEKSITKFPVQLY
jgi:hypothetical protein